MLQTKKILNLKKKNSNMNIPEIWNSMKKLNIRIIGIDRIECQTKGSENSFKKIIQENFLTLEKMLKNVQKAYRTSNKQDKKKCLYHIRIQTLNL